jgi:hypothetical protein
MFLGHFALGFAAKRASPRMSLGTAFLAAQFLDLLWPALLLAGLESVRIVPRHTAVTPLAFEHYPYSHSLLAAVAWGAALGLAHAALHRNARTAAIIALLVGSHWLLDSIVHVADLPLTPGGEARVGLGLWHSVPATIAVEGVLLAAAVAMYARGFPPTGRAGRWGLIGLVGLLVAIYAANLFGPAPAEVRDIAVVGQAQWLLVLFGWWVDRHRKPAA